MKNKLFITLTLLLIPVTAGLTLLSMQLTKGNMHPQTDIVAVRHVSGDITAAGSVHSQSEVTLHFQIGGKLAYLPFQKGDSVAIGQTVAQLDTYTLQKQLQMSANAYEMAKNNADQIQENKSAAILEGQARTSLDTTNHNNYPNITEAQIITDTVNRMVDNSLLTQNTAQLQVDLANYALQLSTLTAPFSGVITAEDVTSEGVNITPATAFSLADPSAKVFRAQVVPSDIDFVSVGETATITLDGQNKKMTGSVVKVYPQKTTLPSGQSVYEVDIQSDELMSTSVFGQSGSVLIKSNNNSRALMVPNWAIVNNAYVWVWDGKRAVLKHVSAGKVHDTETEILSGLSESDKIITSPQTIASMRYIAL